MTTPAEQAIRKLGLSPLKAQGVDAWVLLVLTLLDQLSEIAPYTGSNPFADVLFELKVISGPESHAYKMMEQYLTPHIDRINRGGR